MGDFLRDGPTGRIRVWRLQYGPCWCHSFPSESGSFDFARLHTTSVDGGSAEENILIVSARVIDGTKQVFRQVHSDVPPPKIVVSSAVCPATDRFWGELPVGWTPVGEILPVDLQVEACITGKPEELVAAVLSHYRIRESSSNAGSA